MAKPEFYTVQQLAEMFSCSVFTVRRWIKAGRLECVRVSHVIRVTPQQLAKFTRENSLKAEPKTDD